MNLPDTFVPIERRRFVVDYYNRMRSRIGLNYKAKQTEDLDYPDIQDVLFSEYIEIGKNKRQYYLFNAAGQSMEYEDMWNINSDIDVHLSGSIYNVGLYRDVACLHVAVSWHKELIFRSFDLYKYWIVEKVSKQRMESIILDYKFDEPLD